MQPPTDTAVIACNFCSSLFHISAIDLDIQQVGAEDRQMGPEIFYWGQLDTKCPSCNRPIEVTYEASEYPVGVPNYCQTDSKGGSVRRGLQHPIVDLEYRFYELEDESKLVLPEERKIITDLGSGVLDLLHEIQRNYKVLYKLHPRKFEELIAEIFALHDFSVELTKTTRDGGRDIIAIKSDLNIRSKFLIECKRYAENRPIGVSLVRALYGTQVKEGANKAILATTSRFTEDAKSFAATANTTEWAMSLRDIQDLRDWVKSAIGRSTRK